MNSTKQVTVAVLLTLLAGFGLATAQGPDRAQIKWLFENSPQYAAPAQYDTWWDELVLAVNAPVQATLEGIVWHAAPARGFGCPVDEKVDANTLCVGQWLSTGDIFIASMDRLDERVVKHEMLHAILNTGGHPAIFRKLNL